MGPIRDQKIVVRCMVFPDENNGRKGYSAVCVDLSLFAWRPRRRDARDSLHEAILGYLETVGDVYSEEELRDWKKVVLRPIAFWPFRALFWFLWIKSKMPHFHPRNETQVFSQQVPALRALATA